jgi:hypothetical protein
VDVATGVEGARATLVSLSVLPIVTASGSKQRKENDKMINCPKCGREPKVWKSGGIPLSQNPFVCQIHCPTCIVNDPSFTTDACASLHEAVHQWERLVAEWVEAHPTRAVCVEGYYNYAVFRLPTFDLLQKTINAAITQGWKCQGGVAVYTDGSLMQAMTKEEA